MTERSKIASIYVVVAILSAGVIGTSLWIREARKKAFPEKQITDYGKEEPEVLLTLEGDLVATNQAGEEVSLSALKDKVWVASQFFANCPKCLTRNSGDLRKLYEEFRGNPDFHVVSISVNPADKVEDLKRYADSIGAETGNWWFLTGPPEKLREFMEKKMKFMRVVENEGPDPAVQFSHDLGFQVFARGMLLVKKRDLYYARQQGEDMHRAYYAEVESTIRKSLAAREAALESP